MPAPDSPNMCSSSSLKGSSTHSILVNLAQQRLEAREGSKTVRRFHCATGDKNNPTPQGRYRIRRKHAVYRSKKYDAQMNNAMFFHEGYAIHESSGVLITSFLKTYSVDSLGSHGCVRLSKSDAAWLFAWAPCGTEVIII